MLLISHQTSDFKPQFIQIAFAKGWAMLPPVDRRPRYLQAADALSALLDRSYAPGSLLPPADQLAQQIGVSRSTLREAMGYLEHEGRLIRKQGVGTFVAKATVGHLVNRLEQLSGLRNLANAAHLPMEVVVHEAELEPASPEVAAALGLACGTPLAHTHVVASIGGRRIAYFDGLVSADRVDLDQLCEGRQTLLEHLLNNGKPAPAYTDSRIHAVKATDLVAQRLDIQPGEGVLLMVELFYSDQGKPIVLQHAYLLTEHIDYRLLRRVTCQTGRGKSDGREDAL
jgi:GntR family transcriptional regulator